MPREAKSQSKKSQATSEKKSKQTQYQFDIEEPEKIIHRKKRKFKEEKAVSSEDVSSSALQGESPPTKIRVIDVSQTSTSNAILLQEDHCNVSECKTQATICSSALPSSNLGVIERKIEQRNIVPPKKRKYNRQTKICDAQSDTNNDDTNSRLKIDIQTEGIQLEEIRPDVQKCKVQEPCSSKSKFDENKYQTDPPNPNFMKSAILSVQEQKLAAPQMRQKYNRKTKKCDTKTTINDSLSTISSSNKDIIKLYNSPYLVIVLKDILKCKTSKVHISSKDIQEKKQEMTPPIKRKYNRRNKVCIVETIKNDVDSSSIVSNSTNDIKESDDNSSLGIIQSNILQCKTSKAQEQQKETQCVNRKYNRRTKVSSTKTTAHINDSLRTDAETIKNDSLSTVSISNVDSSDDNTSQARFSSKDVQEQQEVVPQVKRKCNRRNKVCDADVKECENFSSLAETQCNDLQCLTSKLCSSPDIIHEQPVTPRAKRKHIRRTKTSDAKVDESQSLNSCLEDQESKDVQKRKYIRRTKTSDAEADESYTLNSSLEDQESKDVIALQKRSDQKRKSLGSNMKNSLTVSPLSYTNPDDFVCSASSIQDGVQKNVQKHKKRKKVSFAKTCSKFKESPSTSTNMESEIKLDFLPIITESCKQHVKRILLTAVQFQRHSHRKRLSEADVSKALAFYNGFKVDSEAESVIHFNSVSDEEGESVPLSCHGKWLG